MKKVTDSFVLSNGILIPCLGFGTWQSPPDEAASSVRHALLSGYRHIDTAAQYGNEPDVGRGIRESGVPREEIFLTTKLWNDERGYETTLRAFERSLKNLETDYIDLYLIHWPATPHRFENWQELNLGTWRAFEKLYKEGRIRAIGISNFMPHHMKPLLDACEIVPMVNQIEIHPGMLQPETVKASQEQGMLIEAWSPLGTGRMLKNETLMQIASKYNVSTAQLCLRYALQHGYLPLAKSVTPSRIDENMKIFDFEISAEDMAFIDAMPYFGGSGFDPDKVDF
ncbi:MAG: aldo/keto reductase [Clostridia bacterium]|nr:aldo/keto reductase [Clostridia bacterium]